MKLSLLTILLGIISLAAKSQLPTTIGGDVGILVPKFELYDPGGSLKNASMPCGIYGFNFSQGIHKNLSIETGYYFFTIYGGPNFKFSYSSIGSNILDVYQFPLRLKYNFPVIKKKITGDLRLGFLNNINGSYYSYGGGSFTHGSGNNTGTAKYFEKTNFHHYFPMFEAGIGLNFRLFEDLHFSVNTNFQKGFLKVFEEEIYYQYNSEPIQSAYLISRGNNYQILFGLKYPVSNIWQKSEERKASKPERMKTLENAYAKRFYLGVKAGPLWRTFIETNPDVFRAEFGRFSFWEFQYADFNIGLTTGMKFYKNLIFETGFFIQNYTNRINFRLGDSLGIGHSFRFDQTAIRELPLQLKYNYRFPSPFKRLSVCPTVGVSLFHSKIKGTYKVINQLVTNTYSKKDTIIESEQFDRLKSNIIVVNTGIELNYFVSPKLILSLEGQVGIGFNEFDKLSANYLYRSKNYSGDIIFKGSSQRVLLGVKIPFDITQ